MTTPNRQPLWEVMADAFLEAGALAPWNDFSAMFARCKAAEVRAVAQWIEKRQIEDYGCVLPDVHEVIEWLTDEASRLKNPSD